MGSSPTATGMLTASGSPSAIRFSISAACSEGGLLYRLSADLQQSCTESTLNGLLSLGSQATASLRAELIRLLGDSSDPAYPRAAAAPGDRTMTELMLLPQAEVTLKLPCAIGDYTDFYASMHHAIHVGQLFRPDDPLTPAYKHLPIAYHGRASSIVVSGTPIRRPQGQRKPLTASLPEFTTTRALDYELEIGLVIGRGNPQGQPIPIAEAEDHLFGLCLLNDWSARDIQSWEYQPLGPFLGKSFATSISPWVVPLEALAPYRVAPTPRAADDPALLPYLISEANTHTGTVDITLEVHISSIRMRAEHRAPHLLSRGTMRDLFWTPAQMIAHHTSNGCNLRPGDLLGTGTISGEADTSLGCLLERTRMGVSPLILPTGESRTYLEDGDEIVFHAYAEREGLPRIGFGSCSGRIAAHDG